MKPWPLFLLSFLVLTAGAQSLDYISVRRQNGQVVKNFYTGSAIVLQVADGSYLQGPIEAIRNDSVYVTLYDVRYIPTIWGTYVKDTVAITVAGIRSSEISRIFLHRRKNFLQRTVGPLLMLGGAGYLVLNLLNGAADKQPVTDSENLKKIGIAVSAFGLGYLLKNVFRSDGFTTRKHRIVYVDL